MEATLGLRLGWGKVLPCILQAEATECGLTCLAMIAGFHGYRTDLQTLRQRFAVSLKGMSLAHLIDVASKLNLSSRPLRVEMDALGDLACPAILHWGLNHFVVLQGVKGGRFRVHDPAIGVKELGADEVSKHFSGVAVEMEPSLVFERRTEKRSLGLRRLMGKVRGLKTSLLQVMVLALALEIFALVTPFLTQWIIDDALVSGDRDLLTVVVIGIVLLGVLRSSVTFVRAWVLVHMGTNLNVQWVSNVMGHLLRLPMAYFEKRHMGDIVSRFGAVSAIQQTLTTSFVAGLIDGLMAITTLVMMFIYSVPLGMLAVGSALAYGILRLIRYDALRMASEGQVVRGARLQTQFMETIRGMQAVKLFNRQADRKSRYVKLAVDMANTGVEVQRLTLGFQTANGLLVSIEGALVLWIGSRSVLDGAFTIGMLIAFIAYKDQFISRVSSLIDKSFELRMLRIQTDRLADIVLTAPEPDASPTASVAPDLDASIELKNVRFRYSENEPWIIDGVTLRVADGESIALIGPSGCGKTTLVKIMLGLLQPVEGEVLIGGVPVQKFGLSSYRALVGTVMQNDTLFAGSLEDNICFFDSSPDLARVVSCAKLACIHEGVAKMPMGYHTLVGDMGSVLSGGQTQRLLLARALYKRPRILFLDEATSHMDAVLERHISTAISALSITRIVVAHRAETIQMSGRVVQFDSLFAASRALTGNASALPGTPLCK